jgi:hypothetical protein
LSGSPFFRPFRLSFLCKLPPTQKKCQLLFFLSSWFTLDGLVKILKTLFSVIPVKTGIQSFQQLGWFWLPPCEGMAVFYETIPLGNCPRIKSLDRARGGAGGSGSIGGGLPFARFGISRQAGR